MFYPNIKKASSYVNISSFTILFLSFAGYFCFRAVALRNRIEELIVDQAIAKMVFDEIENDNRAGVPAEYFYYYDKLFPYPVAAAQVITMNDGARYIAWLACDPAHIGHGHGSALLTKILSEYRSEWVLTLPSRSAVGFYEKHGFRLLDNHLFGRRAA